MLCVAIRSGTSGSYPSPARVTGVCGLWESKSRARAGIGDQPCHRERESVTDEAAEHCRDGEAARVILGLPVCLWKLACEGRRQAVLSVQPILLRWGRA